jgi:AAA ATPase domain
MELLERASVLDELDGVLAATTRGGRVVLVAGEAGIGKSALVRGFSERHSADARFLLGACDPLLTPRALGPLHDLGRQTGGRLAALLAAGSSREQLFATLLDELGQGPPVAGGVEPHGDWMLDGYSVIVDPAGTVLAGPLVREEGILYATLDLDAARARRRLFDPVGHYNRPDVFRLVVDDRPKPHLVSLTQAEPGPAVPEVQARTDP